MNTTYKIYANLLTRELKAEVEGKLEEEQFGFKPGRGTNDAVCILNYVVNREITKKKGKIFVFFPDLKATFDKVDRKILREMLERIGVTE